MNHATLAEVLQAQPLITIRHVKPATVPVGSVADSILEAGAARIRAIYAAGKRSATGIENFFDACADTARAYHELTDVVADDHTLALANSAFERAGFIRENLLPTTLAAQVDMQIVAMETAVNARNFLAQQQSFNLGA